MGQRTRNDVCEWEWGKRTRGNIFEKEKKKEGARGTKVAVILLENVTGTKCGGKIMVTCGKNSSGGIEATVDGIIWFHEQR